MKTIPPRPEKEQDSESGFASDSARLEYHWQQFIAEFPTEQDCVHELYRRVYGHGMRCPACNSKRIRKLQNARIIICRDCKKETYTLAGTFFHNIREAKRWLAAIWYTDHGIKLNASSFARLLQVVRATADTIFKKLSFVVISKMSELPEISSGEFIATFRKRSRLTPAGEHPVAEQTEIEKAENNDDTTEHGTDNPKTVLTFQSAQPNEKECTSIWCTKEFTDREKTVYDFLSTEPIHIELLLKRSGIEIGLLSGTLVMLEMRGLVRRSTGDWYSRLTPLATPSFRRESALDEQAQFMIDSFTDFVHSTFKGISRKYLQNYLGWYWCIVDRKRWKPGALLKECSGYPKISLKEILQYCSPLMVKFSPLCLQ